MLDGLGTGALLLVLFQTDPILFSWRGRIPAGKNVRPSTPISRGRPDGPPLAAPHRARGATPEATSLLHVATAHGAGKAHMRAHVGPSAAHNQAECRQSPCSCPTPSGQCMGFRVIQCRGHMGWRDCLRGTRSCPHSAMHGDSGATPSFNGDLPRPATTPVKFIRGNQLMTC